MRILLAVVSLILALGYCLPGQAALRPVEELYWLLPWDLTARNESALTDLLRDRSYNDAFQTYGVRVQPPTWGFDLPPGLAIGNRLQFSYPDGLLLTTPVVGTEGWETSCRAPRGREGGVYTPDRAMTQTQWLGQLADYRGPKVALVLAKLATLDPEPTRVAAYVQTFAQWCQDHGKTSYVWLSVQAFRRPGGEALLKAVVKASGALVDQWVWMDAPGMVYGTGETDLAGIMARITTITPPAQTVLQYARNVRTINNPQRAEEYMAAAQAAGINQFVVLGAPEDRTEDGWRDFYGGLSLVVMPPPCGALPGYG